LYRGSDYSGSEWPIGSSSLSAIAGLSSARRGYFEAYKALCRTFITTCRARTNRFLVVPSYHTQAIWDWSGSNYPAQELALRADLLSERRVIGAWHIYCPYDFSKTPADYASMNLTATYDINAMPSIKCNFTDKYNMPFFIGELNAYHRFDSSPIAGVSFTSGSVSSFSQQSDSNPYVPVGKTASLGWLYKTFDIYRQYHWMGCLWDNHHFKYGHEGYGVFHKDTVGFDNKLVDTTKGKLESIRNLGNFA